MFYGILSYTIHLPFINIHTPGKTLKDQSQKKMNPRKQNSLKFILAKEWEDKHNIIEERGNNTVFVISSS